jgi:hypothetical protein
MLARNRIHVRGLLLTITLAVCCAPSGFAADEKGGGFGIGPGMFMVENLKPGGAEVDIFNGTATAFEVYNGTDQKHIFTLYVAKPPSVIGAWETGYDPIPDPAWCRLEKTELEVPPKTDVKVRMFIKIPDKVEYYNKKWMACVVCSPGKPDKGAVGLQVATRVQIETLPLDKEEALAGAEIGLSPSTVAMWDTPPTGAWQARIRIRNNTKEEHTYALKSLKEIEPKTEKHDRYYGSGFIAVKESWLGLDEKSFALKPGQTKDLVFNVTLGKVEAGKRYEELLFVQDEKGATQFARIRTAVAGDQAKKP